MTMALRCWTWREKCFRHFRQRTSSKNLRRCSRGTEFRRATATDTVRDSTTELWTNAGISYEPSDKNRSEIYLEFLPALNSQKIQLLDLPRLKSQLLSLERKVGRNQDLIDHPAGQHDDLANACAGALGLVMECGDPFALLTAANDGGLAKWLGDRMVAGGLDGARRLGKNRFQIRAMKI